MFVCSSDCLTAKIWIDWSDCLVGLLACLYLQVIDLSANCLLVDMNEKKINFVSFVHFSFQITKRSKVKNATCAVCICTSYKEKVDMCLLVCVLVFWLVEWLRARLCTWELKSIANIFWSTLFFWWKKTRYSSSQRYLNWHRPPKKIVNWRFISKTVSLILGSRMHAMKLKASQRINYVAHTSALTSSLLVFDPWFDLALREEKTRRSSLKLLYFDRW